MKKFIYTIILIFLTTICIGQTVVQRTGTAIVPLDQNLFVARNLKIPVYNDTTQANLNIGTIDSAGLQIYTRNDNTVWIRQNSPRKWSSISFTTPLLPGGPFTSIPALGDNPGTNISYYDFVLNTYYKAQAPLATLTGGNLLEFSTGAAISRTLTWGAFRQLGTTTFSTINVNGNLQTFTQPSAPGSVSGTQSVSVPINVNSTYTNLVTAINGMTGSASTTFTYKRKIFAGFVSTNTPTDADIIGALGSIYVGGTFSDVRLQTGFLSTPASSSYIMFASPSSFGTPTIVINGLTVAFTQITKSFININGYSSSYYIMISPFPTSGQVDIYSIQ